MKKIIFTLSIFFVLSSFSNAQTKTIQGKVVAFKTYPVKNVKISSKKLKTDAITDEQGNFTIKSKKKIN